MGAAPSGSAPTVTVAGLGPADAALMPPLVRDRLGSGRWWLRTRRHPAASEVSALGSFDSFYDDSDTFEHTYERIAAALIAEATEHGAVGYAGPGSAPGLGRTVELLGGAAEAGGSAGATAKAVAASSSPIALAAGGHAIGPGFIRLVYTRMFLRPMEARPLGKVAHDPGPLPPGPGRGTGAPGRGPGWWCGRRRRRRCRWGCRCR